MKSINTLHINWWSFWAIFVFIVGCFTFIYIVFPPTYDEWDFMSAFMEYDTDADGHHSLWMGVKHQLFRYDRYHPPRIGNTIGPLMLFLPRWIPSVISGIGVALCLLTMMLLAGIKQGQTFKLILLSFLFVFGIDWQNHMFCLLYSFNYVLTIPIFLIAIYLFLRDKPLKVAYAIPLGIILGLWHEAFALSFIIPSLVLMLMRKVFRTRWRFILVGATCLGVLIYFCFPSVWVRTSNEIHISTGLAYLIYLYSWYFAVAALIVCALRKQWRSVVTSPLALYTVFAGIITIPLVIRTSYVRIAMPAMVLAIILLVRIFNLWWPKLMAGRSWKAFLTGAALFIVTAVHLLAVCYVSVQYNRANADLTAKAWAGYRDDKTIFTDLIYPWQTTPLAMSRPDKDMFITGRHHIMYIRYFFNNLSMDFVPSPLRHYRAGLGKPLSDTTAHRLWEGYIISPNLSDTIPQWANIKYPHYTDVSPVFHAVFVGADSIPYVYTQPIRSTIGRYMGDPEEISFDVTF